MPFFKARAATVWPMTAAARSVPPRVVPVTPDAKQPHPSRDRPCLLSRNWRVAEWQRALLFFRKRVPSTVRMPLSREEADAKVNWRDLSVTQAWVCMLESVKVSRKRRPPLRGAKFFSKTGTAGGAGEISGSAAAGFPPLVACCSAKPSSGNLRGASLPPPSEAETGRADSPAAPFAETQEAKERGLSGRDFAS